MIIYKLSEKDWWPREGGGGVGWSALNFKLAWFYLLYLFQRIGTKFCFPFLGREASSCICPWDASLREKIGRYWVQNVFQSLQPIFWNFVRLLNWVWSVKNWGQDMYIISLFEWQLRVDKTVQNLEKCCAIQYTYLYIPIRLL